MHGLPLAHDTMRKKIPEQENNERWYKRIPGEKYLEREQKGKKDHARLLFFLSRIAGNVQLNVIWQLEFEPRSSSVVSSCVIMSILLFGHDFILRLDKRRLKAVKDRLSGQGKDIAPGECIALPYRPPILAGIAL